MSECARAHSMEKWEYLVMEVRTNKPYYFIENGGNRQSSGDRWMSHTIPTELNELGKIGWELIKIGRPNDNNCNVMYTFKRPLDSLRPTP